MYTRTSPASAASTRCVSLLLLPSRRFLSLNLSGSIKSFFCGWKPRLHAGCTRVGHSHCMPLWLSGSRVLLRRWKRVWILHCLYCYHGLNESSTKVTAELTTFFFLKYFFVFLYRVCESVLCGLSNCQYSWEAHLRVHFALDQCFGASSKGADERTNPFQKNILAPFTTTNSRQI